MRAKIFWKGAKGMPEKGIGKNLPKVELQVCVCVFRVFFHIPFPSNPVWILQIARFSEIYRSPRFYVLSPSVSETGQVQFRRAWFQTPNSVIVFALTEFRGES